LKKSFIFQSLVENLQAARRSWLIPRAMFSVYSDRKFNLHFNIIVTITSRPPDDEESTMRRKLYFMLPGVPSARVMLNELLLAGLEGRHIHFQAQDGTLPAELNDTDFRHALQRGAPLRGARLGVLIGGIAGIVAVVLLAAFPADGVRLSTTAIIVGSAGGAVLGAWASGLHPGALPGALFEHYSERIADGQVLLIVEVQKERVAHLRQMITRHHPEVQFGGEQPPLLAFL
jgi:hypothetical protein